MDEDRPEVILFIVDAGGGHRASANALVAAAEEERRPFRFRVVNVQELLAPLDLWARVTGRPIEATYNEWIRSDHTRFLVPALRFMQWLIRRMRGNLRRLVVRDLRARPPALALSLFPNFNAVLRDAVREALPGRSLFVLLTDYADFPPHFWMETGLDRVIVGSDHAADQARALGLPPEAVTRTSGMVMHPRFYSGGGAAARVAARAELNIPADAFTVMELFGGKGSAEMEPLTAELLRVLPDAHVIAACGDNPALCGRLAPMAEASGGRLHALGFTRRIADYLAASDLLVTKPGPGSLAEALQQRVPVVVASHARTIPQERWNAEMVQALDVGRVARSVEEMPAAAAALRADAAAWARVRANLAALPPNRAVYEVLDLVEAELRRTGALRS